MSLIDQYKRAMTRSDIVGGPYNRPDAIVQRGFHPTAAEPVFFDDGVRINSGSGTNLYDANQWSNILQASGNLRTTPSFGSMTTSEIFLKLSRPVNEIAFISIPMVEFAFTLTGSSQEFGTAQIASILPRVGVNLIKTDMSLGKTFGLDNLTGNNSEWFRNSNAHGTLYQTATNFQSFGNRGALLWDVNTSVAVDQIVGGQTEMVQFFGTLWGNDAAPVFPTKSVSFLPAESDGPYFGVHIFLQSRDFGGVDELFFWKGTVNWDFSCDVTSPRLADGGDSHRAFVFDGSLFS